jgi:hypothetical protein
MRLISPFLAIYGAGIAATFTWLFSALSGTLVCAVSRDSCQTVIGLTGQLALAWPAYWGGRIAGEPVMVETLPFKVVVASVLVFVAVLVLARIHAFFESRGWEVADDEPPIVAIEPNRRNQSAGPPAWGPSA